MGETSLVETGPREEPSRVNASTAFSTSGPITPLPYLSYHHGLKHIFSSMIDIMGLDIMDLDIDIMASRYLEL